MAFKKASLPFAMSRLSGVAFIPIKTDKERAAAVTAALLVGAIAARPIPGLVNLTAATRSITGK